MRHFKILTLVTVVILGLFNVPVWAATEGTINVTVTPQNISLSVNPGSYSYGALGLNTTSETPSTFAVNNDGNVTENFLVKGYNTAAWTLAATNGSNQYVHDWKEATGGSYAALTTSNATAASGVAAGGSVSYRFRIKTPTSTSSFAAQAPNVTFTATE